MASSNRARFNMPIANMKYQEEATLILVLSQPFDALFSHKK